VRKRTPIAGGDVRFALRDEFARYKNTGNIFKSSPKCRYFSVVKGNVAFELLQLPKGKKGVLEVKIMPGLFLMVF